MSDEQYLREVTEEILKRLRRITCKCSRTRLEFKVILFWNNYGGVPPNAVAPDWNLKTATIVRWVDAAYNAVAPDWNLKLCALCCSQ